MVKGADIDENVIKQAQRGIYDSRSVKDVPPPYLEKYFSNPSPGRCMVNPEIRNMVVLEQLNLMERRALRNERYYDFIFCRNMLIYFEEYSGKVLETTFMRCSNKGAYYFFTYV